jgi:hypothetical protein
MMATTARIILSVLLILLSLADVALAGDLVSLANGRVSFEPPTEFRAMTEEMIRFKFPRGNPPTYVYANEKLNVSVAITFSPQPLSPSQLPELKAGMEQTLPRMVPGLKWLAREIVEINGTRWVHFELTSHAIDTDIHNHMYMTSFDGKLLGFNFNSTIAQYEKYKDALVRSRNSIRVMQ